MTEVTLEYLLSLVEEDAPSGDITTDSIIPPDTRCNAVIIAKDAGIICGLSEAERLFTHLGVQVTRTCPDGANCRAGGCRTNVRRECILHPSSRKDNVKYHWQDERDSDKD